MLSTIFRKFNLKQFIFFNNINNKTLTDSIVYIMRFKNICLKLTTKRNLSGNLNPSWRKNPKQCATNLLFGKRMFKSINAFNDFSQTHIVNILKKVK